MPCRSIVELRSLRLPVRIGSYGPSDVIPAMHLLDLSLTIDQSLVLIAADEMSLVFDYDPLVKTISELARDRHYETQEYLMTRIVHACAAYPQIEAVEIALVKSPVLADTGTVGVRLLIGAEALASIRNGTPG